MKILVINGHPRSNSFLGALANAFVAGAREAGHDVDVMNLSEMSLEKYLGYQQSSISPLQDWDEVREIHERIVLADHYVFAYPIWWGLPPALLKVFIEVGFAPNVAFRYLPPKNGIVKWEKLLSGKTSQLLVTADSPPWFLKHVRGAADERAMKRSILGFCGVKPTKTAYFGSVKTSTLIQREAWLRKAQTLGLRT